MTELGESAAFLDTKLSKFIDDGDRKSIWESARKILDCMDSGLHTVMGLGYVQSGKTTSISALCATASDRRIDIIVAVLGSTILLRDQNSARIQDNLGFSEKNYRWGIVEQVSPRQTGKDISNLLEKGRTVFIPVIKNAQILRKLAAVLAALDTSTVSVLIIDDEADQGSLNTSPNSETASSTNRALNEIRVAAPNNLYVQYTATPYAPLLLESGDPLMPEYVEFLKTGRGYTGGREFFIENRERVVRTIPESDEQRNSSTLGALPGSLQQALTSFVVGSAYLIRTDPELAPISMLIHSTFKNDLQDRYHFLVERFIRAMRDEDDLLSGNFRDLIDEERSRLHRLGVPALDDIEFMMGMKYVLKEATTWLVNSASEVKKINWNFSPFHILIGGNKLDRGFTVEGLTVTYMNRPASEQIDTLEQRARAFGYRTQLLPFCQFFATARTLKLLTEVVHTEDDLRANLRAHLDSGRTVKEWATEIGLLIPAGARPTRKSVIAALNSFNYEGEWHALRRPLLEELSKAHNKGLLSRFGLMNSSPTDYGRLSFRTMQVPTDAILALVQDWNTDPATSGWRHDEIENYLRRIAPLDRLGHVILLNNESDALKPRVRRWEPDLGFINLFQGRDTDPSKTPFYDGDRELGLKQFGKDSVILQVHHVTRRDHDDVDLYTLAIHLGDKKIIMKDRRITDVIN